MAYLLAKTDNQGSNQTWEWLHSEEYTGGTAADGCSIITNGGHSWNYGHLYSPHCIT